MIGALTDLEAGLGALAIFSSGLLVLRDAVASRQVRRLKRELSAALNEADVAEARMDEEVDRRQIAEAVAREKSAQRDAIQERWTALNESYEVLQKAHQALQVSNLGKNGEIENLKTEVLRSNMIAEEMDNIRVQLLEETGRLRDQLAEASKNDQRDPRTGRFVKAVG